MLSIICTKVPPGAALMMASRLIVDTAFGALCTDIRPPPSESDLPCTSTVDSCCTRLVSLDVVVLEVLVRCTVLVVPVDDVSCPGLACAMARPVLMQQASAMATDRQVRFMVDSISEVQNRTIFDNRQKAMPGKSAIAINYE